MTEVVETATAAEEEETEMAETEVATGTEVAIDETTTTDHAIATVINVRAHHVEIDHHAQKKSAKSAKRRRKKRQTSHLRVQLLLVLPKL